MSGTDLYTSRFMQDIASGSSEAAAVIVPLIVSVVAPQSVVDVGCGPGAWIREFCRQGVSDVLGIDGSYVTDSDLLIDPVNFSRRDLNSPLTLHREFDLAISLEVAEHLLPARATSFIRDICALAEDVVFSAAIPYQGGVGHINERWQSYWVGLFQAAGFGVQDIFRPILWDSDQIAPIYAQNLFLFRRGAPPVLGMPLDVVHPKSYAGVHSSFEAISLRESMTVLRRGARNFARFHRASRLGRLGSGRQTTAGR